MPLGLYFGAREIWVEIKSINPSLAIALITAASTIAVSTITIMVGRYYERKREIEAHFRVAKIEIYEEFIGELFDLFASSGEGKDIADFLRGWQKKIVLKAGSGVLVAYFNWRSELRRDAASARSMLAMDEFFRALRADVGQNSKGLEKGAFVHLILKNPELFLATIKNNPKVNMHQLAEMEKALGVE